MRPLPGRLTASAPLGVLMQAAYQAQPFQIIGGPAWIESDGYAVDAKAAGNPEHEQMMLMLQSLLEDRFQLKVHRESREMPLYALVPARGGLKLRPPRDGSCVEETDVLGPLADPGARLQPPGQDRSPAPRCGGLDVPLEVGGARLLGGKVPMAEFVRVLSRVLGRTVIDQTGFSGVFDVTLTSCQTKRRLDCRLRHLVRSLSARPVRRSSARSSSWGCDWTRRRAQSRCSS